MKYVIWQSDDCWNVTPRRNYYSYVQDVRKIKRFPKRQYPYEGNVIKWMCYHTSATINDFEHPEY